MGTETLFPPLDLPPLYREIALREAGDAFAHACAIAGSAGAGTLVWSRSPTLLDLAVVLEPTMPLAQARAALFVGLGALADALAVHAPPENPIAFAWPDLLEINGAAAGGVRLGWPETTAGLVPDWMVVHAAVRLAFAEGIEPGTCPGVTSLAEEGFGGIEAATLVESFARHLMAGLHDWQDQGFRPMAERYLSRLERPRAARRGLDPGGDLILIGADGAEERRPLAPALAAPSWLAAAGIGE